MESLNALLMSSIGMSASSLALLCAVLAASGFVSGLSGFGFSAIGVASLWILPPAEAIPLLMALSTANQIASISDLRASMKPLREWWPNGPAPCMLGGLVGLPAGLWLLATLDTRDICAAVGAVLILYAVWALFLSSRVRSSPARRGGVGTAFGVGAAGGVIGGFTAFPGSALVVWAGLCGMQKNEQRAIVQPYILTMQVVALATLALSGIGFGPHFWLLLLLTAPVTLPFTKLGVAAFRKMSDVDFKRAVLGLLSVSGATLSIKGSAAWIALAAKLKLVAVLLSST
jgi:uncharacterized membrane protein YfcA